MATRRMHVANASQQELRFLGHRQKGSTDDYIGEDDGTSIARSSIDLSQELQEVAPPGCFSATLKRNFKAFCGRLGKWTHASRKPASSSLYRYLHINVPLHDPLYNQRQKRKSRQPLLEYPSISFKEHAYIPSHEEVKDIHLDPQFLVTPIKDQADLARLDDLDDDRKDTKPHDRHPQPYQDDYHQSPHKKISTSGQHDTSSHPPLAFKPSSPQSLQQHGHKEAPKPQVQVLTRIHELLVGVEHALPPQSSSLHPTTKLEKSPPSRSPQAKPTMPLAKSKPLSPSSNTNIGGRIINFEFQRDAMDNKVPKIDNDLSSLAAHVFSMRSQVIKGGFGSVYNHTLLQGREESKHDISSINTHSSIDSKDVNKAIASLISTCKFEDLADLEDFLQCYMRLYSPSFLNMVDTFFYDICSDIFECEAWFDNQIL